MVEPGRVSSAESTAVDGCEGSAVDPFKVAASESASFTSASEQTAGCNDNNDSNNKHQPTLLEKPTRPLSAYNLFFRDQRERLLQGLTAQERPSSSKTSRGKKQPHHKIGFSNLAKTIASRWRIIDNDLKAQYEAIANEERRNYIKRVQAWRDHRKALGLSTKMGKKKMKTQARATQPKVVAVADVVNYPTDDYLLANHHVPHIGPSTDNGQATWGQPNHFYPVQRPYHHTEEEAYDPQLEPLPYEYSDDYHHFQLASEKPCRHSSLELPVSSLSQASQYKHYTQPRDFLELMRDDSWTEPLQAFPKPADGFIHDQGFVDDFRASGGFYKGGVNIGRTRYGSGSESVRYVNLVNTFDASFSLSSNPQHNVDASQYDGAI